MSDTNDRERLDYFKSEIKEEGQGWWGPALQNDAGEWVTYNQAELEDLILNGEVFHNNPDKKLILRQLTGKSSLMKAIAFWNYLRYVRIIVDYAAETAAMIRKHGYLD